MVDRVGLRDGEALGAQQVGAIAIEFVGRDEGGVGRQQERPVPGRRFVDR